MPTISFTTDNTTTSYSFGLIGYTVSERTESILPSGSSDISSSIHYRMYQPIWLLFRGTEELVTRVLELRNSTPVRTPADLDPITPFEQRCFEAVRELIKMCSENDALTAWKHFQPE